MLAGASQIIGIAGFAHLAPMLLSCVFAAVGEEIIFRAGVYRLIDD
jgi:membrane protease YdiL (CAAX protease family)